MAVDEALARVEKGSGTQFDPNLAPIFVNSVREHGLPYAHTMLKAA